MKSTGSGQFFLPIIKQWDSFSVNKKAFRQFSQPIGIQSDSLFLPTRSQFEQFVTRCEGALTGADRELTYHLVKSLWCGHACFGAFWSCQDILGHFGPRYFCKLLETWSGMSQGPNLSLDCGHNLPASLTDCHCVFCCQSMCAFTSPAF